MKRRSRGVFSVSRLDQNPRLQEDEPLAFIERQGWILMGTFVNQGRSERRNERSRKEELFADG